MKTSTMIKSFVLFGMMSLSTVMYGSNDHHNEVMNNDRNGYEMQVGGQQMQMNQNDRQMQNNTVYTEQRQMNQKDQMNNKVKNDRERNMQMQRNINNRDMRHEVVVKHVNNNNIVGVTTGVVVGTVLGTLISSLIN